MAGRGLATLAPSFLMSETQKHEKHHVCPVWVGRLMVNPLRKLRQSPRRILASHVAPGMRVLDIGCAMGFFSLPLARLVGPNGRVICVDLQQKMLDGLRRRARRKKLAERIETRLCATHSLGIADLSGLVDFALAFAVVHEVGDTARLFEQIHAVLKPGSRALVAEPRGRVSDSSFGQSVATAESQGFAVVGTPRIARSHAALLERGR